MTALVVFTAGRKTYLERTLISFHEHCDHQFDHRVIIDDSGDHGFQQWLNRTFPTWTIIHHQQNEGLAAAVDTAWQWCHSHSVDWVFHLEEDFTFEQDVDIPRMVDLIRENDLHQLVLYRQPWAPREMSSGGYLHLGGWERLADDLWVGSHLFGFNPCLYPGWVCSLRGGLEADVTEQFDDLRSGVLTGPDEAPLCWHIGAESALFSRPGGVR